MSHMISHPTSTRVARWLGIGAIALVYAALYLANLWLPLSGGTYASRIWDWSQAALTVAAIIVLILKRHHVRLAPCLLGLGLAALSTLSYAIRGDSLQGSLLEGAAVWICFLGGVVLFKALGTSQITAFQPPLAKIGRSLAIGVAVAVPLAIVNNLYFYFTDGPVRFQSPLYSAVEALYPAIHEEIVFRFFVLALCLSLLRFGTSRRWAVAAAIVLAVVPHSLNHLPDLFLQNPVMGVGMLVITSLLFGLPMAWLQIKRDLETAIAFHWFIDFARFLFGF